MFIDFKKLDNKIAVKLLLLSLFLGSTSKLILESDFNFYLLSISISEKLLFIATSDIFNFCLLLALVVP